ncbi:MAG: hypothetical protein U0572_05420 [Phycisphaerales bacterium]
MIRRKTMECPYLERGDARCEARFRVDRLDEFYAVCCDRYHSCAHFGQLRTADLRAGVDSAATASPTSLTALSLHGRPLRVRAVIS